MPRRVPAVPPGGHSLLLGTLLVKRPRGSPPYMMVAVYCPDCGRRHTHGWLPEYGLAGIAHRAAHCGPEAINWGPGYYIGLDPAHDDESRRILARFPRRR